MLAGIEEAIRGALADRGASFVFPSEAAADSHLRRAAAAAGAIESERFLGWDRFKEILLSARRSERPAERVARTIWAAGVVARQVERPFLGRVLGPLPPSPAFVTYLAGLPPSLAALEAASRAMGRDESLADFSVLYRDYSGFLERHGLFEPAWERLPRPEPGRRYLLFCPELIADFEVYEKSIRAAGEAIRVFPLGVADRPDPKEGRVFRFRNCFEEFRWAFLRIGRLLDEGERPEDIAVTVAGLSDARPYVERAARLAGVPIEVKEGSSLASTDFGRLLKALAACAASDFGFEETRELLLDRFVAWKSALAAADLVRFGIERHAYASYNEGGHRVDIWERSFAVCGSPPGLRDFYRSLRRAVLSIAGAASFAGLRSALMAFRERFLDESGWREAELRTVERAMTELASLAEAEAELAGSGGTISPFDVYLRVLESQAYAPQGVRRAVPVYPYRVSALLAASRHFVLGASQDATKVSYPALPYLREDQKEELGLADRDASEAFLAAYASDPGSVLSYAEEGLGSWGTVPPYFLGEDASQPGEPPDLGELLSSDPIAVETAAWRGEYIAPKKPAGGPAYGGDFPAALLGMQKRAALEAAPSLGESGSDYGAKGSRASAAAREAVLGRRRDSSGALRLSATQLEEYLSCPFAWLLDRGLGIEEEASGPGFFDALLAGEMAHAAVRRLFMGLGRSGAFDPSRLAEYRALVPDALAGIVPGFEADKGPFLRPMFSAYLPLLEDRLGRLLDEEAWMEGWEAGEFELDMSLPFPALGVVLEGRADRVARRPSDGAMAVIDYKKGRLPSKGELRLGEGSEALGGADEEAGAAGGEGEAAGLRLLQMAAYVELCEAARGPVERAAYWSIEGAKRLVVLGPEAEKGREDFGEELAAFERALGRVARGLGEGDFGLALSRGSDCGGCDWKAVCRGRYATE